MEFSAQEFTRIKSTLSLIYQRSSSSSSSSEEMQPKVSCFMDFNKEASWILFWYEHVRSALESTDRNRRNANSCGILDGDDEFKQAYFFVCELGQARKGIGLLLQWQSIYFDVLHWKSEASNGISYLISKGKRFLVVDENSYCFSDSC